jgi:hypothetical protein
VVRAVISVGELDDVRVNRVRLRGPVGQTNDDAVAGVHLDRRAGNLPVVADALVDRAGADLPEHLLDGEVEFARHAGGRVPLDGADLRAGQVDVLLAGAAAQRERREREEREGARRAHGVPHSSLESGEIMSPLVQRAL